MSSRLGLASDGNLGRDAAAAEPVRLRLVVFDRSAARSVGVAGTLMRLERADGAAVTVSSRLSVDYGRFASAYGADWRSRLRLVHLPACALSTPAAAGCAAGTVLPSTNDVKAAWQLWLLWGLAVGIGTGAMALVLGAIVANRWFVESRRGLVTGVFSAAGAAGQLVFLPGIAALAAGPGWRYAALVVTVAAVLLVPLVLLVVADHPADVGLRPLGAPADEPLPEEDGDPTEAATRHTGAARLAVRTLAESTRSRTFWILVGTFWICGWSTNGLIGTHFIPAAHDHGMPQTTAAGLLALIGVFDMVGTVASGWLTDKVDPRWLLFGYYGLRGLSLLFVPALLGPDIHPNLFLFIVFYGLDWVATVPPTIALCRRHFGVARSGVVFGWVFASHMVGAGVAASYAGWVRGSTGDYQMAWLTAGALCVLAAFACLAISRKPAPGSWHEAGEESEVASVA
jgi:MFS family permease